MIPAHYLMLGSFPLTANGKLDFSAFPEPDFAVVSEVYLAPRDGVEEKLAAIWADVLGVPQESIGVNDHFFNRGGHSLKATILISLIHKTFHIKIPLAHIFTHPHLLEQAEYLRHGVEEVHRDILPIEKREYYPLTSAQKRLFFLEQLEEVGTSYNMP